MWKYEDDQGREHVITFRVQRPVADKAAQLLRFQRFCGDRAFACDVMVPDRLIADHHLSTESVQRLCVQKICALMERGIRDYCVMGLTEEDIAAFRETERN